MATQTGTTTAKAGRLSVEAQRAVLGFVNNVLTANKRQTGLHDKMDAIDVAYARYKAGQADGSMKDGVDNRGQVGCGNVFDDDDITPPIVVSQVDSYVAYLADVFLSGTPMFPVVSNPSNKKYAEQLETLLDDHSLLGGYARQFLIFLRDCVKYNYGAVEASWDDIEQFSVVGDFESGTGKKVNRVPQAFTRVKRLNPRNILRDPSVDIGDISEQGDYAGHVELLSKMKMKRLLNKLTKEGKVYNADFAMGAPENQSTAPMGNFRDNPLISHYVSNTTAGTDWDSWFGDTGIKGNRATSYGSSYELITLYARIMPSDFAISAPQKNTPQIWKFRVVNGSYIISAERIVSAYDYLPILFGQPLEDGMGLQTQSIGEGAMPIQKGASVLFNIRFAAARRAVSDRALYVSELIDSKDVNSKSPAPKIPVRLSVLSNKTLDSAYKSIPFESRGLETVMQDAQTITSFGQQLSGVNKPREGQFQKGNKSVTEWNDTMAGSDNRMRLPALTLEHQVFGPFKSIAVLNIFQYGNDAAIVSQRSGEILNINIEELRKQVLAFKMADGYTPKSKLASTDAIAGIMQLISTSPILQQAYGSHLPGMVAHLAQLQGIKGMEEYDPNYQAQVQAPSNPLQSGATLQGGAPVDPMAGMMPPPEAPSMPMPMTP